MDLFGSLPVSQTLSGLAIAALGLPWSFGIAGAGFIIVSRAFILFPGLRNLGYPGPTYHYDPQ